MAEPFNLMLALAAGLSGISYTKYNSMIRNLSKKDVKSNKKLTYISLFTGVGGFEIGIHRAFPNAKCLGFAEIDDEKLRVYSHHFPNHKNLGNIFNIDKRIKADLLVGGFSCKSKSSLSYTSYNKGKERPDISFNTFDGTINIIKNGDFEDIILENVPTSANSKLTTEKIVEKLQEAIGKQVYTIQYDIKDITGGHRNRVFFTTFPMCVSTKESELSRRFEFNLDPYETVRYGWSDREDRLEWSKSRPIPNRKPPKNNPEKYRDPYNYRDSIVDFMNNHKYNLDRWGFVSDTNREYAIARTTRDSTYPSGIIVDRRDGTPLLRLVTVSEGERLLGFPKNYFSNFSKTIAMKGIGDSVSPYFVYHLMKCLIKARNYKTS